MCCWVSFVLPVFEPPPLNAPWTIRVGATLTASLRATARLYWNRDSTTTFAPITCVSPACSVCVVPVPSVASDPSVRAAMPLLVLRLRFTL